MLPSDYDETNFGDSSPESEDGYLLVKGRQVANGMTTLSDSEEASGAPDAPELLPDCVIIGSTALQYWSGECAAHPRHTRYNMWQWRAFW